MSQQGITLGLFLHSHQPVGNYDWVFEQNWERAYRPMLEALLRHPTVKLTLHYSGPLLDWLDGHRPEFRGMVGRLVERGQAEIAGGGYYEPIMAMLPAADREGQIRLMQAEIEQRWGVRPRGAWLAERVWEPGLAAPLARAGVEYTLVDDSHFAGSGLAPGELSGYYLTEDEGKTVAIYPGLQQLRNSLPWRPVERVIALLRREAQRRPGTFLVMGDDGEKFGAWPDTYTKCWTREGGWVERFFRALEREQAWLRTCRLDEWLDRQPAQGIVYLPTGSYHEMEEWSLPPSQIVARRRFLAATEAAGLQAPGLRPGFWRNFLVKYPEAAAMRHRVLRVRELIDGLPAGKARGEAERRLWMGENNCPYWHGIFGGVYLRNIRTITVANLVAAERLARVAAREPLPLVERRDLDLDRQEEVLLRTGSMQAVIDPGEGGALTEWDLVEGDWPLLTVIARRREAYHEPEAGGASISPGSAARAVRRARLVYDPCRRLALQEQLLAAGATQADWRAGRKTAHDLRTAAWELESTRRAGRGARAALSLQAGALRIEKAVRLEGDEARLVAAYRIENVSDEPYAATFVSEWNAGLPAQAWLPAATPGERVGNGVVESDGPSALRFAPGGFDARWEMPVETVSSSEAGLELSYQGLCVAFARRLELAPGETARLELTWSVERR